MEFWNMLGQKANEAYKFTAKKTKKLGKEAKLRIEIGQLRCEINNIYKDMGKAIFENHVREEKQDLSKELEESCIKIDCLSDEIEKKLDECLHLKGIRKCPNCYTEISIKDKYCSECGARQEVFEEPTEDVEDVTEKEIQNEEIEINENNQIIEEKGITE